MISEISECNLKILVLPHRYDFFVKGAVEATANSVESINVLVRHNYLAEISKYFLIGRFLRHVRMYSKDNLLNLKGKPENVNIHLVSLLYFVTDGKNKSLGDKIAKKAEKFIQKKGINFDLIHAHFIYPHGYAGVKLGEKFDIPVVITAHGFDVYDLPFRDEGWKRKIKWVLNQTSHVITVSQSNKKILVEKLGVNENKLSVIPNGFSSKLFYPIINNATIRQSLSLPLDKKIILNVANLYPVKGHRNLIEAVKDLVKYRKDVLCIIIGDGILRGDLKAQIKKLNLENYFKLVGPKPHGEISLWMNAADLFVLPSLSEGNPTVMFEALGVGLPFVGTKVGGVTEIITSEDYGFLCGSFYPKDLTEKILIALDKDWNREKILDYAKQFTWENIAKDIMGIYTSIA